MTIKMILTAVNPVGAIGDKISLSARVTDDKGAPQKVTVNWSVTPAKDGVKLDADAVDTDADTGLAANSVTSTSAAALIIKAAVKDGPSAELSVGFSTADLSAPSIPEAGSDHELDAEQTAGLVQAVIKRHSDAEIGDIYSLFWGNNTAERADDGTAATFPWVMDVKKTFSASDVLADGEYGIYYTILDTSGNLSYSPSFILKVTGGNYINSVYEKPRFPELKDNTINADSISNEHSGVMVKVTYPQDNDKAKISAGDVITLFMKVYDKNNEILLIDTKKVATVTIAQDEITNNKIEFYLPGSAVSDEKDTFDNVRGMFWYSVEGVENSGTSYTQTLVIDTVPPHKKVK
jgi:hypothetical protein